MQDLVELTVKSSSGLVMDGNGTWAEVLDVAGQKKNSNLSQVRLDCLLFDSFGTPSD